MLFPLEIDATFIENKLIRKNLAELFKERRSTLYILPGICRSILSLAKKTDCWIAGGASLALYSGDVNKIKDWDLFFKSPHHLLETRIEFENFGFKHICDSEWSQSFQMSETIVQFVNRHYYLKVEDIFKKFDFTICCFAVEKDNICFTEQAKNSYETKEFDFIFTENIPTCIKRIARYGAKGFIPSNKFVYDFSNLIKKTKIEKLKKQSTGKQS